MLTDLRDVALQTVDFTDLQIINGLSNGQSQAAVAKRLKIDKSVLGKRLAKLEKLTNQTLVARSGGLRLTPGGERLRIFAETALQNWRECQTDLEAIRTQSNRVRIMANASLLADDLPPVLKELRTQHPKLLIDMLENTYDQIPNDILTGKADCGLLVNPAPTVGLKFEKYKTGRIVIVAPTNHPLSSKTPIDFVRATVYEFIGVDNTKQMTVQMESVARQLNYKISFSSHAPTYELQASMVAQSVFGIALMMESVARRMSVVEPLKIIQVNDQWADVTYSTCVRDGLDPSSPCIEFIQLLQNHCKNEF